MRAALFLTLSLLTACGARPAPEYPAVEPGGLADRTGWHRALGDPSWSWQRGVAGWELGQPSATRTLDGPIPPRFPVEFGIDPARTELLQSYRPMRTWSRPVREFHR